VKRQAAKRQPRQQRPRPPRSQEAAQELLQRDGTVQEQRRGEAAREVLQLASAVQELLQREGDVVDVEDAAELLRRRALRRVVVAEA
jgi:hypothetical protein